MKQGIIVPLCIDEPSECCNSSVCGQKPNGKIRFCLDLTQLNKCIVHPHHDAKFSITDARSLSFMMVLSKESSYLTTFATMFGRYRYVCLPMGASLSSDCFQYKMDQIFSLIAQSFGNADDLAIFSYSKEDHDWVLFQVLDTAKCVGLRFNPDKCIFKCTQILFFGMLIGADGIRPDPKKIEALNCLPLPGNVRTMHLFLGIVNY